MLRLQSSCSVPKVRLQGVAVLQIGIAHHANTEFKVFMRRLYWCSPLEAAGQQFCCCLQAVLMISLMTTNAFGDAAVKLKVRHCQDSADQP